jgi:hypothetical protein
MFLEIHARPSAAGQEGVSQLEQKIKFNSPLPCSEKSGIKRNINPSILSIYGSSRANRTLTGVARKRRIFGSEASTS